VKSDLLAEAGSAGLLALEGRGGLLRHREEPHVCAADGLPRSPREEARSGVRRWWWWRRDREWKEVEGKGVVGW
jgi:hypothetical protein